MTRFYVFCFLLLAGLPAAVAQTVTSVSPTTGPVGTLVTLTGTDLDRVTGVAVNGTAGVVVAQSPTSLRLLVMPGTTSGPLTTTGGTPATTAAFTVAPAALNAAQQGPKLVGTGGAGQLTQQGYAVALSADGNTLAVGGNMDDNGQGAVWVFARTGATWGQQGPKLVGTGATVGGAQQGRSVSLSADGNTLAVGGSVDNSGQGAVWVFTRTGAAWNQQGPKLVGTGITRVSGIQQGIAVSLSADGNTLAVGGPGGNNTDVGATWVFARTGTGWAQQGAKLVGTGTIGFFGVGQGISVSLSADGRTLASGGAMDNGNTGATWVFSTATSPLAQRPVAGPAAPGGFFPNPVTDRLTLTGGAGAGTWRLFDGTGRTRLTGAYHAGYLLDLSALPTGPYWLQVDQKAPQPLLKN